MFVIRRQMYVINPKYNDFYSDFLLKRVIFVDLTNFIEQKFRYFANN